MRSVFWRVSLNLLLVYPAGQFDELLGHLREAVKLLTTVTQVDVILYVWATTVDSASFLNNAMRLTDQAAMPLAMDILGVNAGFALDLKILTMDLRWT